MQPHLPDQILIPQALHKVLHLGRGRLAVIADRVHAAPLPRVRPTRDRDALAGRHNAGRQLDVDAAPGGEPGAGGDEEHPLADLGRRQRDDGADYAGQGAHEGGRGRADIPAEVGEDEAREGMHERDVGRLEGERLERERHQRTRVRAQLLRGQPPARQVDGVQRALLGAAEDGHDAPEGGGFLEQRQEVDDEADAGVVGQGGRVVEALGGFCPSGED